MFNSIVKKLLFLFTYGISMQCIAVSELLELEKDRVSSCESEFKESVENSRSSSGASSKAEVGGRVKSISFSGCGAYYPYQCGIAYYLRKHFELEGVITLGASGGVLPALSLVMDVPAEKFEQFFVNEITGIMVTGLARYWFGGATRWLGVTREMLATLPVDTYERASGKVYVSATRLNRFGVQEEHITGWKSNDEMIEAILCSTYIPFFSDGFLYKTYKGRKYVDGAILDLLRNKIFG